MASPSTARRVIVSGDQKLRTIAALIGVAIHVLHRQANCEKDGSL
jgi:hypothetical protein